MYRGLDLAPPLFEVGPKAYLYGAGALELARAADRLSLEYDVRIVFTPQYVDIPLLAQETERLLIFAQHMDPIPVGPGAGSVLPESLVAAGAHGVMLNHSEKPIGLSHIRRAIERADEVGLATIVCADTPQEAAAVAQLAPNIILAEPPELIGSGGESVAGTDFVGLSKRMIKAVNPDIVLFSAAGIRSGPDVAQTIRLGAEMTGSTSGIIKADDPIAMLEEMIVALRQAWDETHPT